MGRKKILIKPIECPRLRSVTFYKRRKGLLKKAMELAVLCQSHVFLAFVDNETGKLVTFNSHSYSELQGLFSKTPLHLREQYKTNDVSLKFQYKYEKLFGEGDTLSKNGRTALRVKTEEDQDQPYLMDSSEHSQRKKKRTAKHASKRTKQAAIATRNNYLMPPQPYSFVDSNSRSNSHMDNSEEYEDEIEDVRSRGRVPIVNEEVKRRASVKEERGPINAIINVFEPTKRVDEEEEMDDNRLPSRKLKEKLNIKDLNLGEQKEKDRHPHQYFKQQSFKFSGGRDTAQNQEAQTLPAELQGSGNMLPVQQAMPQSLMNNNTLYQQLQQIGTPQAGYPPVGNIPPQPMSTFKDYSPYPMLMTPSPFPRLLMNGTGGTGQPNVGLDIGTHGLFQTTSPIYPYGGLIHTPGELSKSFSGQGAFKVNQPSPIGGQSQLPSAISNIAQASSSLTTDRLRRGSEFSFFTHDEQRKQPESGNFRAMDWYQELLRLDPIQNQNTPLQKQAEKTPSRESDKDKFQQDSGKKQ